MYTATQYLEEVSSGKSENACVPWVCRDFNQAVLRTRIISLSLGKK